MNLKRNVLSSTTLLAVSNHAFAAGGAPEFIDFYSIITHSLGLSKAYAPIFGALFVMGLITLLGFNYKKYAEASIAQDGMPSDKFSFGFLVEMVVSFIDDTIEGVLGHAADKFRWLMVGLFVFILVGNLSGLIPGFPPPTVNMSTNVGMGLIVFFVYNFAGFKEHGIGYLKQFAGPLLAAAPLMIIIETISHFARPFSLGLRLMGNIFGDHMLVAIFTGMTVFVVPSFLMFFGVLVAFVQSFVFTLLSGVYISMAVSHDH